MWKYNLKANSAEKWWTAPMPETEEEANEAVGESQRELSHYPKPERSIPVQGEVKWLDGEDVTGKFTIGNGHFSIYSKPGTKVTTDTLHIGFGYESDKEKAMQYLTPKAIYIIDRINVYDFNTTVYLKEFENIGFNSVHFISPEIVAIPINIQEQPQHDPGSEIGILKQYNTNYAASMRGYEHRIAELEKELANYKNQSQEQPIESDLIIAGLEEGSEMWKAEYDNCRKILEHLVQLKEWKDTNTNMDIYNVQKPLAWQYAKKFLEKYQHQ